MADAERIRWPWWRAVRWATIALALIIGASALQTGREADALDDEAATLTDQTQATDDQEARALRQGSRRVLAAYDVDGIVSDVLDGNVETSRALRAMTDALNRAVDRANAGDLNGLHQVARNDGGEALGTLRRLLAGQRDLLAQIDRVLRRAAEDDEGANDA